MTKLRYVNVFTDRHGRRRAYFRYKGSSTALPEADTPEFYEVYARCLRMRDVPAPLSACDLDDLDDGQYVYFIGAGAVVKIGITTCVRARLAALQTASPHELVVEAVVPGEPFVEAYLHSAFRKEHIRGEWFHRSAKISKLIRYVRERGQLPVSWREDTSVEWEDA